MSWVVFLHPIVLSVIFEANDIKYTVWCQKSVKCL